MFTITVDDEITLQLEQEHHHSSLFDLLEKNRSHVSEYLGEFDKTLDDTRQGCLRALNYFATDGALILLVIYKGQLAGWINLHNRTGGTVSGAEIGYWLGKEFVGRGIITRAAKTLTDYAFAHWDVNRVFLGIAINNSRSYAIPERLGFTVEGTLRQNYHINDEWVDHRIYTMLKDEWTLPQDPPILRYQIDEHLELRLVEKRHAQTIYDLCDQNREHIGEWLPWIEDTQSVDDTLAFIDRAMEQYGKNDGFQAGIWYNNQLVGMIGYLYWNFNDKETEIGYWLAKDATGHGIMTRCTRVLVDYAINTLALNRVVIQCAVGNEKSCAVAKRLGFTHEGILRQTNLLHNQRVGMNIYSILSEEWQTT